MINGTLQACSFILTLIGWVMAMITCALPVWRIHGPDGCLEAVIRTSGLWLRCTYFAMGSWSCNDYDTSFQELPMSLKVIRVTLCLSIGFGFLGIILATIGLDCTTMASDKRMKAILVMIAGVFHIIAGVFLGAGTIWFAVDLEYHNDTFRSAVSLSRDVFGEALYIGWAGSGISVIGGIVMVWSSSNLLQQSFYYNQPKLKVVSAETSI